MLFVASSDLVLPGTWFLTRILPTQHIFDNRCCCAVRCCFQGPITAVLSRNTWLKLYRYCFFNRCCRYVVRWFQGPGSWMAIDLPGATSLSGMEASFEDGDRRTQKFDIVLVGENEVRATASSTRARRSGPHAPPSFPTSISLH